MTMIGRTGNEPLYLEIARTLEQRIESGELVPGDRLPTHRELARELGVAVATVSRAYGEAERRGSIESHVGRGTYVRDPSPTVNLPVADPDETALIDLGLCVPIYAEDPDLAAALVEVSGTTNLQSLLQYQAPAGPKRHRLAGVRWAKEHGYDCTADQVLVCGGVQHAMSVALSALLRPGDVVLAAELTFTGIKVLGAHQHWRLEPVAMDREGIQPESLEKACRLHQPRALYCMPTMQKPDLGRHERGP